MNVKQVEEKVIELIHREPFAPFFLEMKDGQSVEILHPRLAINETGAGFFGPDDALVDVEFKNVRAVRVSNSEAVA